MDRPPLRSRHPRHPLRGRDTGPGHLEIPVLSGRFKIARRFIDGGMAASIRDPRVLARTITIYGSVDAVCDPLGITSRENVSVRMVRRDGTVLWGCTGAVTDELLGEAIAALPAP